MSGEEIPVDTGDEVQVKDRRTKAQLARETEIEELRRILDTPGGRWFCWRMLAKAGTFQTTFRAGRDGTTEFLEGQRHIGSWLLSEVLTSHKDAFILMRDEAKDRELKNGKQNNG